MREYILEHRFFLSALVALLVVFGVSAYRNHEYNDAKKQCVSEKHMFVEGVCYSFNLSK